MRDWKIYISTATTNSITLHQLLQESTTVQPTPPFQSTTSDAIEINAISFEHDDNAISVMIEDGLSNLSTLKAVMKEGGVANKFGLDIIIIGGGE